MGTRKTHFIRHVLQHRSVELSKRHTIIIIILCYNHKYEEGGRQSGMEEVKKFTSHCIHVFQGTFSLRLLEDFGLGFSLLECQLQRIITRTPVVKGVTPPLSTFCCVLSYLFLHPFEGVVRIPNWFALVWADPDLSRPLC